MSGDVNSSTLPFHELVILPLVTGIISAPFSHLSNGVDDACSTFSTLFLSCSKKDNGVEDF